MPQPDASDPETFAAEPTAADATYPETNAATPEPTSADATASEAGAAAATDATPAPARRGPLAYARIALAAIVLVAVVVAVARNWADVSAHLREVSPRALILGVLAGLMAPILTMFGWRVLLADLGSRIAPAPAAGVYLVGQLGKFVPGSVWAVLAQAEMGARLQIPRRRTAVVGLLAVGLALLTGLVLGLPVLPTLLHREDSRAIGVVVLIAIPAMIACLHPRVLNLVIDRGLRMLRREPLEHPLSGRAIAVSTIWFVLAWVAAGLQVVILARDLGADASLGRLALVGGCGFALASAAGMIAVVLPAGVGVRDGLLVLLLDTVLPLPAATAIAVLIRFSTTFADIFWALVGWLWARAHHLLGNDAS